MIELNAVQTVAFGGLALFLGYALCRFIPLLGRYNLPPPVIGGLVIALLVLLAHGRDTVLFQFDTALPGPLMVAFFTAMGVNASVALLKISGKPVMVLLALASGFAVVQALVGLGVATVFGVGPMIGVLGGSAPPPAQPA